MATDVAVTIHASSGDYYAKTQSWTNGTQYDQVVLDEVITANRIGTGNNGKYYTDWRFYTNGSDAGSFSIDAAEGYELQSVTFTYTVSNSGALYMGETKLTSKTAVEVSGQKAVFQCKNTNTSTNGQVRLTAIAVTYQEADAPATGKTFYLALSADWAGWPAKYSMYYFKSENEANGFSAFMTEVPDTTNIYTGTIPDGYDKMIFVRHDGEASEPNWDNKWSQTVNLDVPTNGDNLFTVVSGGTGSECNGTWSVYGEEPAPYVPTLENGFYLIGKINGVAGWEAADLAADRKFEGNPDNNAEFVLSATLAEGDEIKVVNVLNDAITAWFPTEGGNYVVDANHAGEKTIYFRPDYQGGEDWFGACIYIAPNETPTPQPTAVVLPATLDVTNVSFRSEGMPDFVIEEGQDYAGTYFDMGAHDSSNDTLLYAEWNVTIEPIKYNISVDVYNENSWRVQLYLLSQAGDTLKSLRYKGSSGQKGQFAIGSLDLSDLEAGDYKVIARAATAWSKMKLKDVIFTADYQGVNVDLPGTLLPAYAELSAGASIANNAIAFVPSTANNEYAIWNVTFAEAGDYNVTIDMTASNGHTYGVALLSADGESQIGAVAEAQAWDTGVKELGAITVPAAGSYKVKLTNATQWSEAVLNSITFAAPAAPALENGFYLVGNFNTWNPAAEYHLVGNPDNNAEFMVNVTLAENDELKVVNVLDGNITAWFPAEGDNYVVDANHAGEKTIYFRPDYQGGEDWFGACIYIAPNAEPQPASSYIFEWVKGEGAKIEADNTDLNANNMGTMTAGTSIVARLLGSNTVDNNAKGYKLGNNDVCVEIQGTSDFAVGDTVIITGVCGGSGARAFAIAPETTTNAVADTALTTTQENTSDILEFRVIVKEAQAGAKMRIFRMAGKTMYLYSIKVARPAGVAPVEPTLANGFYLIGQNGWDVAALSADLLFAANPDTEGEYVLNTTLAEGQEIKVVKVENDAIVAWYPAEGANYTVDAAHAGENKDIYFQETYKEDWAAFGGHIWTGSNEEPVVEKYCEKPSGHQANPEFGDPSGRILLTIAKGEGNNIVVKIKNNNEAGNTHTGLNYLWVNAEGATGGVVRYGDGTHAEADVEEVSVIVPFEEARESYNFLNIHWAYSGWEGEWAIDGLTVTAAELCEGAAPVEPTLANGFYLIGQNGWDVAALSADLLFAANPDTEGEYKLTTTLAEGQSIKVVKVENDAIVAWYPDGMGNEYTVDAAHAGENKDIYFQETYKEDWAAFGGYFWTGENGGTAISNTAADAEAVKVLNNGMLLIRKGNKTYNVMGQAVK